MRTHALLLLIASGCSLYFGPPRGSDDGPPPDARPAPPDSRPAPPDARSPPPDAQPPPDGGPAPSAAMARCEDGLLYETTEAVFPDQPGHGAGRLFGSCAGGCRSAAVRCTVADCADAAATLCGAPASRGATCSLDGQACQGAETLACPEATTCGNAVPGSTCSCAGGKYRCTQLTPAASVQAALVGKWRGVVTPPGFAAPYPITLWIYPDGTYWPDCPGAHCSAFYYGGDGPSPDRKLTILSASDTTGAWADIAIDFGLKVPSTGALSALAVDATTLRFTFFASWSGCDQPFDVALTRY